MSTSDNKEPLDLIGIGIGPFNLGLSALLTGTGGLSFNFFDAKKEFSWHDGMLLEDSELQVPFLADLVSMCDPTHKLSFLNYLHEQGRLYRFYHYEKFQIPRVEYNQYCIWASNRIPELRFNSRVVDVSLSGDHYLVSVLDLRSGLIKPYLAKHLAIGIGSTPFLPELLKNFVSEENFIHTAQFIKAKHQLQSKNNIVVIGSGQSAAECFLDLLKDQSKYKYQLNWITRAIGFLPMEYSKLGCEHFSPDYIEHFFNLSEATRQNLLEKQQGWYKGISNKTISEIYDLMYIKSIKSIPDVILQPRSELIHVSSSGGGWNLKFKHLDLDRDFSVSCDAVVLGLGYRYEIPSFLDGIRDRFLLSESGLPLINRNYVLESTIQGPGKIFIQNGEMHTHGISAPDLGLGCYRNAEIINQILGYDLYSTSTTTTFQSFGINPKLNTSVKISPQCKASNIENVHA